MIFRTLRELPQKYVIRVPFHKQVFFEEERIRETRADRSENPSAKKEGEEIHSMVEEVQQDKIEALSNKTYCYIF